MKKLFLIAFLAFSSVLIGQTNEGYKTFVSTSVSMHGGNNFEESSFPSVTVGVAHKGIAYGVTVGRNNFVDTFADDRFANYFWELEFSPTYRLGSNFGMNLLAGGGAYFDTNDYFAELGVGMSYTTNHFTYGLMFSNFDTRNYVTPTILYTF